MMKHTTGEWKVVAEEQDELAVAIDFGTSDTGYLYIATIHEVGYPDSLETLPNAYLIAAAPELLDACQRVRHWLDVKWERPLSEAESAILLILEKAVSKATGPAGLIQP